MASRWTELMTDRSADALGRTLLRLASLAESAHRFEAAAGNLHLSESEVPRMGFEAVSNPGQHSASVAGSVHTEVNR